MHGTEPRTTETCLIFNQHEERNLALCLFTGYAVEHGRSIGHVEFQRVKEIMYKVNCLAAAAEELVDIPGLTKKRARVHGCPRWFFCLPVICCLGACCVIAVANKKILIKLTSDINKELDTANQSGIFKPYVWRLCAAEHDSVQIEVVYNRRKTIYERLEVSWIELADPQADHDKRRLSY